MKSVQFTHQGQPLSGKYTPKRSEASFQGLPFRYEMRCADDSTRISTIEKRVRVNFAGTLFLDKPLDPLEQGVTDYIELTSLDDRGDLPERHI